jgi:hypothetical protein
MVLGGFLMLWSLAAFAVAYDIHWDTRTVPVPESQTFFYYAPDTPADQLVIPAGR